MTLKEAFNKAFIQLLQSFGVTADFCRYEAEPVLSSASEVNVFIGLTNGAKGNVLLGMSRKTALSVVTAMTGTQTLVFDETAQSAISEFMNMLVGMGLGNLSVDADINFSSPVLVSGDDMHLMFSPTESLKMLFTIDKEDTFVAIDIE